MKINIIDSLKARFGGAHFKGLLMYLKLRKHPDWPFNKNPAMKVIADYYRAFAITFFLTEAIYKGTKDKDIITKMWQKIVQECTSSRDDSLLDFDGIIIPTLLDEDGLATVGQNEFFDILLPHLIDDIQLFDSLCFEGPYEHEEVRLNASGGGGIALDCGANIGMFSAIASRKGYMTYAFEPGGHAVSNYLSVTAKMNPNIFIVKSALMDKEGEIKFLEYDSFFLANTASDIMEIVSLRKEWGLLGKEVAVNATTVDAFVNKNNLPGVDFIKADIEGAERYMLMGAKEVLKEFAPMLAICTYHLPDDPEVLRELILDANPNYVIKEKWSKMYAHVPV